MVLRCVLISSVYMWLSSFPSTTCWRCCLFSIVHSCLFYHRLGDHVWMWELNYKESWALKNWCFWTVVLEKTLESPLDCKEIQPVHPKGNQSWIIIGRTDDEAETPILWPPNGKNWLIWKYPDAGKDWRQEEKGTTGWDSLMASLMQWTWVWASSRNWWWTGRPGMLQSMGSQRGRHDWATELTNWNDHKCVGLSLDFLSCSINPNVCFCASNMVFHTVLTTVAL